MTNLGIREGEFRYVAAPVGDYKTIYCLSLAKSVAENGGNVVFYSFNDSVQNLQKKLLKSGIRLGAGRITFKTMAIRDLTSLRKQMQVDATVMKNLKLMIVEDVFFATNDYMSNQRFFQDVKSILNTNKIACVFTSQLARQVSSAPISINDIKYSSGAMHLCDTVYGIKTVKNRLKLSLLHRFLNIFRKHHKMVEQMNEKQIYLSVLKNRFGGDTAVACKLKINEDKLEVKLEE